MEPNQLSPDQPVEQTPPVNAAEPVQPSERPASPPMISDVTPPPHPDTSSPVPDQPGSPDAPVSQVAEAPAVPPEPEATEAQPADQPANLGAPIAENPNAAAAAAIRPGSHNSAAIVVILSIIVVILLLVVAVIAYVHSQQGQTTGNLPVGYIRRV